MAKITTYPNSPHYDDFNANKNYYRILFKPGYAVQARELTQLQTMLQQQIADFGTNIFKEGSLVIPGDFMYDYQYRYVKLDAGYTTVDDLSTLVGKVITGDTTGMEAKVVNYANETATDPPTIYVKYLNSGADFSTYSFADDEVIQGANVTITAKTANASATGYCSALSSTGGVLFTRGNFVHFDKQTKLLDKYTIPSNVIVGFTVTESIVSSDDDTSLLDPAVGVSNYFAPGADRYSIELTLDTRNFVANTIDDPNFVEVLRIEDGGVINFNTDPTYNVLRDTMARRTYDESGDYTVRPYQVRLTNHLLTSNVGINDGLLDAANGGNADIYVAVVSPGKAYVKGYEVDNIVTQYYPSPKSRDSRVVTNGAVPASVGNYTFTTNLFSIPDVSTYAQLSIYDRLNSTPGTANGTLVGYARIRGYQFESGTIGTTSAVYKTWLSDIEMLPGYTFERDAKQFYYNNTSGVDFTADIVPQLVSLTGSVQLSTTSSTVAGTGTKFTEQIAVDDYFRVNGNVYRVTAVASDTSLTIATVASANVSGVTASLLTANVAESTNAVYVTELPFQYIKTVDTIGSNTTYYTRRMYDRTLSGGSVSITAGTDETFAPHSSDNYQLVALSGAAAGTYVNLSGLVTRSGTPTGKVVTFDLSGLGSNYTTADVRIIATMFKQESAADKKVKTLTVNQTIDFTANNQAVLSSISLSKADIYQLVSVKMSSNAFGTAYNTTNEIDITDRYTLDNGQRATHYDVGKINLTQGQPYPTGPLRVTFDYFQHGAGDFFTVDSYSDIDYKDIPTFTYGNKVYNLRDCLDFRSRIDDAGNGYSSVNVTEFMDSENDIATEYEYYLPRVDKIVLDVDGSVKIINGVSSLTPKEPHTPENTMLLYVLNLKPYVFDVNKDIDVETIDNRRFTMRDIGRIENRVKNLEYYTTLSMLERETAQYQIKDGFGFDRFKNGFIVDNFQGHGIGDTINPDYAAAIDFNAGEVRPLSRTVHTTLVGSTPSSNAYVTHTGGLVTLPYQHTVVVQSKAASTTENVNPFDVILWSGTIKLDPPGDMWVDTNRLPTLYTNKEGNYNTLVTESQAKGTYGTVWGAWRDVWYGNQRTDIQTSQSGSQITTATTTTSDVRQERTGTTYTVVENISTTTQNDVVISSVVIPKMRSVSINFDAHGMKPNTRVHAFFDDILVNSSCISKRLDSQTGNIVYNTQIITDETGSVSGVFSYDSRQLNLETGNKTFVLTDSPTNGIDRETTAATKFEASGTLVTTQNQITSTRNGTLSSTSATDTRTTTTSSTSSSYSYVNVPSAPMVGETYTPPRTTSVSSPTTPSPTPTPTPQRDIVDWLTTKALGAEASTIQGITDAMATGLGVAMSKTSFTSLNDMFAAAVAGDVNAKNALTGGLNAGMNAVALDSSINKDSKLASGSLAEQLRNASGSAFGSGEYKLAKASGSYTGFGGATSSASSTDADAAARATINSVVSSSQNADLSIMTDTRSVSPINQSSVPKIYNSTVSSKYLVSTPVTTQSTNKCALMDPLAQSFFIESPTILTKVDLFLSAKDSKIPLFVEIRRMTDSGFPGPYVIPFSGKAVRAADVLISDNASVATTVSFDSPVYLEAGHYALVLLADTTAYRVWISEMGQTDIITNKVISKQPYIGSLFKSQNAATWSPYQYQDLKFNLYRAVFDTSADANLDLVIDDPELYTFTRGEYDAFEVFPGSSTMRIHSDNHGLRNGSYATIRWLDNGVDATGNANVAILGGVPLSNVVWTPYITSNVTQGSYTINLPAVVDGNVIAATRFGGPISTLENDVLYDTMYPAIASIVPTGTSVKRSVKTIDTTYAIDSTFTPVNDGDIDFDTPRVIPSNVNAVAFTSVAAPVTVRLNMSTTDSRLSPLIDMKKAGLVLARNLVNKPTYSSETLGYDVITVANSNTVSFAKVSNTTGYIRLTTAANIAAGAAVTKGTTLTITASSNNNGTYRVLNVEDSGANILLYGTINTAAAGSTVTAVVGTKYVAEEAAAKGSVYSKYITKQVNLNNPSTSINFRIDTIKPIDADIKIYYRTKLVGETTPLTDKEFVEMTGITIPTSLAGEYYEIEKQIDGLSQFNAVQVKIVFTTTNSAKPPKCRKLRLIALA